RGGLSISFIILTQRRPPNSPLFPYTTLFRSFTVNALGVRALARACGERGCVLVHFSTDHVFGLDRARRTPYAESDVPGPLSVYGDRKSTRLNSSHSQISYAVFCLKKKNTSRE